MNQSITKTKLSFSLDFGKQKTKRRSRTDETKICHMKLVKIKTKMNGDAVFLVKCVCVFCLCSCSCVLCVCG